MTFGFGHSDDFRKDGLKEVVFSSVELWDDGGVTFLEEPEVA